MNTMKMQNEDIKLLLRTPDNKVTTLNAYSSQSIGYFRDYVCKLNNLDPSMHSLTYKMVFLDDDSYLDDFGITNYAHVDLVYDFRARGSQRIKVTLKIENTLCSAYFHPDVSLWTVVEYLVASEIRCGTGHPTLIHNRTEFVGAEKLNSVLLRSLKEDESQQVQLKFIMTSSKGLTKLTDGCCSESTLSAACEVETRSFSLFSLPVLERRVDFKDEVEYIPDNDNTLEEDKADIYESGAVTSLTSTSTIERGENN